ncbi:NTP pyrophosphatase (non-canonical NTP hydrolase) [Streptomyces olivoverticillatus]|uniref:NTP pyrophosphatase (Non-canonical NTP hydrolase) n=1 Tax=Streptomyces olivoverticillatus TaxID=66427 RepID=A0A7W7LQR8_9ACTN|nr:MazG-like family protein [Streptomyces olivoverticillatus]MBB4894655.1 NTP pyrophosphatase (non-canonical NTP hydrolase) [Streptomyces olivoverticillatus]
MDQHTWATVDRLVTWLDENNRMSDESRRTLRVKKLTEEVGEVAQAVIGATGQNPRKGTTHTWADVENELCDVVLTAMVALRTLTPDAARIFAERLDHVAARSLGA